MYKHAIYERGNKKLLYTFWFGLKKQLGFFFPLVFNIPLVFSFSEYCSMLQALHVKAEVCSAFIKKLNSLFLLGLEKGWFSKSKLLAKLDL